MDALTPAERKRAERERHRKAGRVPVTVHVLPEQRAEVRALEARLSAQGLAGGGGGVGLFSESANDSSKRRKPS